MKKILLILLVIMVLLNGCSESQENVLDSPEPDIDIVQEDNELGIVITQDGTILENTSYETLTISEGITMVTMINCGIKELIIQADADNFELNLDNTQIMDVICISATDNSFINYSNGSVTNSKSDVFKAKAEDIELDIVEIVDDMHTVNGHLVFEYIDSFDVSGGPIDFAKNINMHAANNPDIDFYSYYIESDIDVDFENKINPHFTALLLGTNLDRSLIDFDYLEIDTINDFLDYFYKTDHHWSGVGQKAGYDDIITLLSKDKEAFDVEVMTTEKEIMLGYKAAVVGGDNYDGVDKFSYIKPAGTDYNITINNEAVENYGGYDLYEDPASEMLNKTANHYNICFPGNSAFVEFENNNMVDRDVLLVIGGSYTYPLRACISQYYSKTYFVDIRRYESIYGETFDLENFFESYDVDEVIAVNYAVTIQWGGIDGE